jgi:superfamily II DNA or RNA helicase
MPQPSQPHLKIPVLDTDQIEEITSLPTEEQERWLLLETHPEFKGCWLVNGFSDDFFFDLEEIIGSYCTVSPANLDEFRQAANSAGYSVAFIDSPEVILHRYAHLNDPPPVKVNSDMPNTVNGFLPWQVQGVNFLKDISGKAIHSTGTGKTIVATGLIKYNTYDICLYVCKAHNKISTQRKLKSLGDIDSIILDASTAQKRADLYANIYYMVEQGKNLVLITNYEKFREDEEAFKLLFEKRNLLVIYDEMPTRLSNRDTRLYRSVLRCFWRTKKDEPDSTPNPLKSKLRVKSYRAYELTATPIENDPEGDFNTTRLIDPSVFGSVKNFRDEYVSSYSYYDSNKPESWHNLDKMALQQAHITHIVNKKDPDIAKFFPKDHYEPIIIDWDPKDRRIYDTLTGKATALVKANLEEANVLALIGVMQMMCDMPSMINTSAANRQIWMGEMEKFGDEDLEAQGSSIAWELIQAIGKNLIDANHTKLITLRDILLDKHPDDKCLVYTTWNNLQIPTLSRYLTDWGIEHVTYTGTAKHKQESQDRFRSSDSCRVFLSSDAGSDSWDAEMAAVGIDYNLPWKYSTRIQRWNRRNRVNSPHKFQYAYGLIMADSIEDRKQEIISRKQGYHETLYEGKTNESAISSRITKQDLKYILGV